MIVSWHRELLFSLHFSRPGLWLRSVLVLKELLKVLLSECLVLLFSALEVLELFVSCSYCSSSLYLQDRLSDLLDVYVSLSFVFLALLPSFHDHFSIFLVFCSCSVLVLPHVPCSCSWFSVLSLVIRALVSFRCHGQRVSHSPS